MVFRLNKLSDKWAARAAHQFDESGVHEFHEGPKAVELFDELTVRRSSRQMNCPICGVASHKLETKALTLGEDRGEEGGASPRLELRWICTGKEHRSARRVQSSRLARRHDTSDQPAYFPSD